MEIEVKPKDIRDYGFIRWSAPNDDIAKDIFTENNRDDSGKYRCNLFGSQDSITINFDLRRVYIPKYILRREYEENGGICYIDKIGREEISITKRESLPEDVDEIVSDNDQIESLKNKNKELIQKVEDLEFNIQVLSEPLTEIRDLHTRYSHREFNNVIKFLLERMGYINVIITDKTGDRNIDLIAETIDPLGVKEKYVVQVKQYAEKNTIKPREVRQFTDTILSNNAKAGIYITTSRFTTQTIKERKASSIKDKMILIDGKKLLNLMREGFWNYE